MLKVCIGEKLGFGNKSRSLCLSMMICLLIICQVGQAAAEVWLIYAQRTFSTLIHE